MTKTQYNLIFFLAYPSIVAVMGFLTKFNYIFIGAGGLFCIVGILLSPLIIKFFPIDDNKEISKAKSVNYVMVFGGILCLSYLALFDESIKIKTTFIVVAQMVQYFLSGSVAQAIYASFIE